jgi:exonuclease III
MAYTYHILTLNINGLASHNRQHMPEQIMRSNEVDIAMLQEATSKQHIDVKGYHIIDNIGTAG